MTKVIETERLVLKQFAKQDVEDFIRYQNDEEFKKYMGGAINREAALERFDIYYNFFLENGFGFFSVFLKNGNEWIGQAGVAPRATHDFHELGWAILPPFQGKGYAFEAMQAVVKWCVDEFNWRDFYFCINPCNSASIKLAEKLGGYNIGTDKVPDALRGKNVEMWYVNYDDN